jgi:uncharacterized protein YndB with AHSA1/START domain
VDMDVGRHIGAVTREVVRSEGDDGPEVTVVATRTYDTDVEDLWSAITDAERIPRWFLPVSGDLRLGGRYQLEGNAGGEILTCDQPTHLGVTWEFDGGVTWLDVHLAPDADGGTQLELRHRAPATGDHWDTFGPGAVGIGWDLALIGLALHLETGEQVDDAAMGEFMTTPEGKDLTRAASDAWGQADIAGGMEADAALAAAERTRAAYTGELGAEG